MKTQWILIPFFAMVMLGLTACADLSVDTPQERRAKLALASECPDAMPADSICDSRDGNRYKIVTIGEQTWMAQDARYMSDSGIVHCGAIGDTLVKACRDSLIHLYDFTAALQACPVGWRLPTAMDWEMLFQYLIDHGDTNPANALRDSISWESYAKGTDRYGFGVSPTGSEHALDGYLRGTAYEADFWTRSYNSTGSVWMGTFSSASYENVSFGSYGFTDWSAAVRCIQLPLDTTTQHGCDTLDYRQYCDLRNGQRYSYYEATKSTWMTRNLNYNPESKTSWCYGDDSLNCRTYGRLYPWEAASDSALCPQGWHLPTDSEWTQMEDYIATAATAGNDLKLDTTLWNGVHSNHYSDVQVLPGGLRLGDGTYAGLHDSAFFWTASPDTTGGATDLVWYRAILSDSALVRHASMKSTGIGMSIRCFANKNAFLFSTY